MNIKLVNLFAVLSLFLVSWAVNSSSLNDSKPHWKAQTQSQLVANTHNMLADYLQPVDLRPRDLCVEAEEFLQEKLEFLIEIASKEKTSSKEKQNLLKMVVDTIVLLKEIENACVIKRRLKTFHAGAKIKDDLIFIMEANLPEKAAILYPILFETDKNKVRIMLVVTFHDGNTVMQLSEPIHVEELEQEIENFRDKIVSKNARDERARVKTYEARLKLNEIQSITDLSSFVPGSKKSECSKKGEYVAYSYKIDSEYDYCPHAHRLYQWFIGSIDSELKKKKIDTLVIIPPDSLFNIPFAALHDGNNFLIENYALALTFAEKLIDLRKMARKNISALLSGLIGCSDDNEYCRAPLSAKIVPLGRYAKAELENVRAILSKRSNNVYLLPEYLFLTEKVKEELNKKYYSIVHFTTHGIFEQDPNQTHLVTYDSVLTFRSLENIFSVNRNKNWPPIELLTLTACELAKGGERGIADIAVKTGVRAVFATLWPISDELTEPLVTNFYENLFEKGSNLSKAQALRQAQIAFIRNRVEKQTEKYKEDPYYWAAFVLIGNWL